MEQPLVQIFAVVANIQMKNLKTQVEKGSWPTVYGSGLVGPNYKFNYILLIRY